MDTGVIIFNRNLFDTIIYSWSKRKFQRKRVDRVCFTNIDKSILVFYVLCIAYCISSDVKFVYKKCY